MVWSREGRNPIQLWLGLPLGMGGVCSSPVELALGRARGQAQGLQGRWSAAPLPQLDSCHFPDGHSEGVQETDVRAEQEGPGGLFLQMGKWRPDGGREVLFRFLVHAHGPHTLTRPPAGASSKHPSLTCCPSSFCQQPPRCSSTPPPLEGLPCSHSLGPAPPSHAVSPEVFVQFLDEGFAPWRDKGLSGACPSSSVLQLWAQGVSMNTAGGRKGPTQRLHATPFWWPLVAPLPWLSPPRQHCPRSPCRELCSHKASYRTKDTSPRPERLQVRCATCMLLAGAGGRAVLCHKPCIGPFVFLKMYLSI